MFLGDFEQEGEFEVEHEGDCGIAAPAHESCCQITCFGDTSVKPLCNDLYPFLLYSLCAVFRKSRKAKFTPAQRKVLLSENRL